MAIATAVNIRIPAMFQSATGGTRMVAVRGTTIGECLKALADQFPGLRRMLYDEGELLSGYLAVTVNGQSFPGELKDIPVKAGDELYPLLLIEGG
jgi:molybdopterin converting factor small subunit